ncbi:MAG: hypothetical protein KJ666_00595 [Bacteroidetes bacterium]|nr:hypothetical protein [Bacteroidota bacterium]MBU2584291.1 hypothetical protein [Bacteroidota bacterium]
MPNDLHRVVSFSPPAKELVRRAGRQVSDNLTQVRYLPFYRQVEEKPARQNEVQADPSRQFRLRPPAS